MPPPRCRLRSAACDQRHVHMSLSTACRATGDSLWLLQTTDINSLAQLARRGRGITVWSPPGSSARLLVQECCSASQLLLSSALLLARPPPCTGRHGRPSDPTRLCWALCTRQASAPAPLPGCCRPPAHSAGCGSARAAQRVLVGAGRGAARAGRRHRRRNERRCSGCAPRCDVNRGERPSSFGST